MRTNFTPRYFTGFLLAHYLITNPFYCGYVRFNGELFEGKHEPLISSELYGMVQGRLKERQNWRH